MKVLAKFRLWEKAERDRSGNKNPETVPNVHLKFAAVQDAIFGPYTPSGQIEMTVVKRDDRRNKARRECLILRSLALTVALLLSGCQYVGCRLAFGGHQQCRYLLEVCDAERPCDEGGR